MLVFKVCLSCYFFFFFGDLDFLSEVTGLVAFLDFFAI